MVIITHPDSVGEEDRHHCKGGIDETGASRVHSGREQKKEPKRNGSGVAKEFSHSTNEHGFAEGAAKGKESSDGVEDHCLVSVEKKRHHFCKKRKRKENGVGTKPILCTIQ